MITELRWWLVIVVMLPNNGVPSLLLFLTTTGALLELAREDTQKQQYSNLRKWSYPRVRIARMTLGLDHDPETDDCMPRACQKVYSRSMQQTIFPFI